MTRSVRHMTGVFSLAACALIFVHGCSDSPAPAPVSPQGEAGADRQVAKDASERASKHSVDDGDGHRLPRSTDVADAAGSPAHGAWFSEITGEIGLAEKGETWPAGHYLTPEITAGGVALFDYDNDGDLDLYQVRHPPPAPMPGAFTQAAPNRLFEQTANGRFVEVEGAAGLDDPGYGHGAALGDFDNDGDVDVFVTNYGPDQFYINDGGGRFTRVTDSVGISGDEWSSAATFVDYDRDGDLDLFVVHFATFDPAKRCPVGDAIEPDYCGPHTFPGLRDTLWRNNGDGSFSDVSEAAGIDLPARGWGVIAADFTGDGWADLYVANDEEPNQLWVNNQDGTFLDEAVLRGVAFNSHGRVEASMGVTVADLNEDGVLDLFMTHVTSETNTLYQSGGAGADAMYFDRSAAAGMSGVDLPHTGWGCALLDLDHDGDADLAVANGRVAKGLTHPQADLGAYWGRYAEANLLFRNDGDGRFTDIRDSGGAFTRHLEVTRALAVGDIDSDGDLDVVTANVDNHLRVFRNDAPRAGTHWVMIRAMTGKRDALGAEIRLTVDGRPRSGVALSSYSYLAGNDPRVHFGLGGHDSIDAIEVRWPSGRREAFDGGVADRVITLYEGTGRPME